MSSDPLDRIRTALPARYEVERELGRGGMAVVYLAYDRKHERRVAIKALQPQAASSVAVERFLREIGIAARLQHPHIVPVYDSGAAGDVLYFVMPYLEGESLRQRLARQHQLPIADAVSIVRDVASALDYAHAHGIVHRDVKPANILLAEGRAMIADFGIARALDAAVAESLTQTGIILGTVMYMSPEQASTDRVDHGTSDQYSLGCVAYEMLVGEPPFKGTVAAAILARHSLDPMPSIRAMRSTVPPAVEAAIARAMAKIPADRFATVTEFADALAAAAAEPVDFVRPARPVRRRSRRRIVAGVAVAAALGGIGLIAAYRGTIHDSAENVVPAGSGSDHTTPRLAVIPFDNLGEPNDSMFAKGITVELTTRLAELTGLDVISRMSAMLYDRSVKGIPKIAHELSVDYILSGSITTDRSTDGSGRARVMPELIRAPDGRVLWRGSQDVSIAPGDLLRAQSEVVDSVARALNLALLPERRAGRMPPTSDREAYEQFLIGSVYASRPRAEEPTRLAIHAFERATTRDTTFAVAYAKLAEMLSMYAERHFAHPDVPLPAARAKAALDRAWSLDSTHPAVRIARGYYDHWLRGDNVSAFNQLSEVAALDTNNAELLSVLGDVLRAQSKWSDALAVTRRAADLDPRSQRYAFDVGVSAAWLGQFAEADRYLRRSIAIAPDWPSPYITLSYVQICWKADTAAALQIMREAAAKVDTTKLFVELISNYREDIAVLDAPWQRALARLPLGRLQVDSGKYYLAKAELHHRLGDTTLARAYFDSARMVYEPRVRGRLTSDDADAVAHAELGLAYAGTGRAAAGVAEGKRALAMVPAARNATTHAYLALSLVRIYIVLGRYDAAIDVLEAEPSTRSLAPRGSLLAYPNFAPLRELPRFQALVRRVA
jgi:serine/threonine-protein kinase